MTFNERGDPAATEVLIHDYSAKNEILIYVHPTRDVVMNDQSPVNDREVQRHPQS